MQKAIIIYSSSSPSRADPRVQLADDDTKHSAELVDKALKQLGYKVEQVEILPDRIADVYKISADLIFNLCEWSGRDYRLGVQVIEILEQSGMIFTGASSQNYIWGSEKQLMKRLLDKLSLPTPRWFVYEGGPVRIPKNFQFPAIVKPAWEHCAIGVSQNSVVWETPTLKTKILASWEKFNQPILAEEFITGNEYQVTVLEKKGNPWVLPPAEIFYLKSDGFTPLLTFEAKWEPECPEDDLSVIRRFSGSRELLKEIVRVSEAAFIKLDCRDYVRIDIREQDGHVYILEVNVNPGIDWDFYYGMTISSKSAGLSFKELIEVIVNSAVNRYSKKYGKEANESRSFI